MSGLLAQGAFLHRSGKAASANPGTVGGSRATAGSATTDASTVSASGGTISSYAWEQTSGDTGITITTPTAASTTFSGLVSSTNIHRGGVFRCKVTFSDATFVYTNDVTANMDFTG